MSLMIQSNATRSREDLRTNRLPRRIISSTAGIILIFVVTLGAFMISMSWALEFHASEQSVVQIRDTQNKLPDQITLASFDWSKWALVLLKSTRAISGGSTRISGPLSPLGR